MLQGEDETGDKGVRSLKYKERFHPENQVCVGVESFSSGSRGGGSDMRMGSATLLWRRLSSKTLQQTESRWVCLLKQHMQL